MPLGQLGLFQKILTGKILDHRVLRLEGGSATVSQPPAPGFGLLPVMKAICAPPARIPNELICRWLEPASGECVRAAFGCDPLPGTSALAGGFGYGHSAQEALNGQSRYRRHWHLRRRCGGADLSGEKPAGHVSRLDSAHPPSSGPYALGSG